MGTFLFGCVDQTLYDWTFLGEKKKREKEKKCCVKLVTGCLGSEELALTKEYT